MHAAVLFYSAVFVTLVVLPALLLLVFLLFLDHGRSLWKRISPTFAPASKRFFERPSVRRLRERYPRIVSLVGGRLNPKDPWGLSATFVIIMMVLGLWFFAGVIQNLVALRC